MIALADSVVRARWQRQSDPVRRSFGRGRRSPAQLHVLLGARRRRASGTSRRGRSSCSRRGVPQIYYVGLLAGENDAAAVERTGEGRADQPTRLQRRRDRDGTPTPGRRSPARAHPPSEHAPCLRRRAPSGGRWRLVHLPRWNGRRRRDLRTRGRLGDGSRDGRRRRPPQRRLRVDQDRWPSRLLAGRDPLAVDHVNAAPRHARVERAQGRHARWDTRRSGRLRRLQVVDDERRRIAESSASRCTSHAGSRPRSAPAAATEVPHFGAVHVPSRGERERLPRRSGVRGLMLQVSGSG